MILSILIASNFNKADTVRRNAIRNILGVKVLLTP